MTMRVDIVTNDAGELVRLERARDMGSANVQAVYRLIKLAQFHETDNQAFTRQLEKTTESISEYGLRAAANFNVLFASRAVFVGGQLLKGSRVVYEMASELGDMLEWCGGSDLTISKDVTQKELHMFAESVNAALRGPKGASYHPPPKIWLRPVTDAARFRGLELENLGFEQQVVRTYSSAVVIMRRFFQDLALSHYIMPRRIKRVAQSLVDLSEGATPAFLGVTDVRNQNYDDAGRAVNTAILAVSMARQLTGDRIKLSQIAMAAMMHDVGRPRAAALADTGPRVDGAPGPAPASGGPPVRISEDAEDKLAAATAAVLTALGRLNEPTITRTVVTFEALWLRRQSFVGPLYEGDWAPTLHARIVHVARRYNDLVTPEPGLPPPLPDFAIATMSREMPDEADQTTLRLLVATLNLLPVGTAVQLTTREVGEIIAVPPSETPSGHPWVRILCDIHGAPLPRALEVELLPTPREGQPDRKIARVLSVEGWAKTELVAEAVASDPDGIEVDFGARETEAPVVVPTDVLEGPLSIPSIPPLMSARRDSAAPSSARRDTAPPVSQAPPSAPRSSPSVAPRSKRIREPRPKVFDPRAEPEDEGPPPPSSAPPLTPRSGVRQSSAPAPVSSRPQARSQPPSRRPAALEPTLIGERPDPTMDPKADGDFELTIMAPAAPAKPSRTPDDDLTYVPRGDGEEPKP